MSNPFDNISQKADELIEKNRRSIEENKAKLKSKANVLIGTKTSTKPKKAQPKSKVARGMEVICALFAIGVTLLVLNLNVWPFSLINGGDRTLSTTERIVLFFGIGLALFFAGVAIVRPLIKRLEVKYGKQAW